MIHSTCGYSWEIINSNLSVSDCSEINVISYTKKTENVKNTVNLIVIGVAASPQQ